MVLLVNNVATLEISDIYNSLGCTSQIVPSKSRLFGDTNELSGIILNLWLVHTKLS